MTQAPFDDIVRRAPFIFRGLVESVGTATTDVVAASSRTAVVTVIEIIRAPRAFARLAGQQVTVELREPGQPPPGTTVIFFAGTRAVADSLVLEEMLHEPIPEGTAASEGLYDALAARQDARLARRLAEAQVVVVGRVSNVRPSIAAADAVDMPGPISEHDPQWSEAVVEVRSVIKGAVSGPVVIVYAASIDVAWFRAPKYHAGQTGVFLLHSNKVADALAAQYSNVYTSLDHADFIPIEDQARARALLAQNM